MSANKRLDPKNNPQFCVVPWTHTYLSPQTERRLCCASREKSSFVQQYIDQPGVHGSVYKPDSLKQHWNSEKMKDIRKRMLAGEVLPECSVCNENVLSLSTYRHWFTQQLFGDVTEKVLKSTDEDGSTTLEPISFDYRFDNSCNFKCRTCGDQFSSSWESENKVNGAYALRRDPWLEPENRKAISDFQSTVVENEFAEAVESKKIREIYWVGGEPLVWKQHWKYMKRIIELGYADSVYARYNTNLSKVEHQGQKLFYDILPHFKDYMISASIDGSGKIGEFIRTGLVWEKWIANFEEGVKASRNRSETSMLFDVTISLPTLFSIEDLLEEALRLDVRMEVKVMYGFDPFVIQHPLAVPKHILHPFLNKLIKKIEPKVTRKQSAVLATLKELLNRPSFEESFHGNYKAEFFRGRDYLREIAKRRNDGQNGKLNYEMIYAAEPAILDWWMQGP